MNPKNYVLFSLALTFPLIGRSDYPKSLLYNNIQSVPRIDLRLLIMEDAELKQLLKERAVLIDASNLIPIASRKQQSKMEKMIFFEKPGLKIVDYIKIIEEKYKLPIAGVMGILHVSASRIVLFDSFGTGPKATESTAAIGDVIMLKPGIL